MACVAIAVASILASPCPLGRDLSAAPFSLLRLTANERGAKSLNHEGIEGAEVVPLVLDSQNRLAVRIRLERKPNIRYDEPDSTTDSRTKPGAIVVVGQSELAPDLADVNVILVAIRIDGRVVPIRFASRPSASSLEKSEVEKSARLATYDRAVKAGGNGWRRIEPTTVKQEVTRIAQFRSGTLDRDFLFELPVGTPDSARIEAMVEVDRRLASVTWTLREFKNYRTVISGES